MMKRRLAAATLALVGVATTTLGVVGQTATAHAAYADCDSTLQHKAQTGLDAYRAGAYCYQVGVDSKVRAQLVRNGGLDAYSVWFTGEYVWRYTAWHTCYAGCTDGYQVADV